MLEILFLILFLVSVAVVIVPFVYIVGWLKERLTKKSSDIPDHYEKD